MLGRWKTMKCHRPPDGRLGSGVGGLAAGVQVQHIAALGFY